MSQLEPKTVSISSRRARELLTKDEKDDDRIFHGEALLRRMVRLVELHSV